jgi:hypothetical protein
LFAVKRRYLDLTLPLIAGALTAVVYADHYSRLGFYSDDAGFLHWPGRSLVKTLRLTRDYVPGRNLDIIWQKLIFLVGGHSPTDLPTLHLIQSLLDAATVVLLYVVARRLGLSPFWAFVSSLLFAFYPNHGETHFWLTLAPQNLVSMLFLLAYVYCAAGATIATRRFLTRPSMKLLVLELLFFSLALFTYDQTFFFLTGVLLIRSAILVRARYGRTIWFALTSVAYLSLIGLYVDLKRHPNSGPTLTHVDVAHVSANFRLSLSETFGSRFQDATTALFHGSSHPAKLLALAVAVVAGIVLAALALNSTRQKPGVDRRRLFCHLLLAAGAAVFFFLAYLPAYVWYISPRHNYLPTLALALFVGLFGSSAAGFVERSVGRQVVIANMAVAGILSFLVLYFAAAALGEKRDWELTWRVRSQLYRQLESTGALRGKTAIVLENFPNVLGRAPFFGNEDAMDALSYLYPTEASFTSRSFDAVETKQGYFLNTNFDRYGLGGQFLPRRDVLRVLSLGTDANTLSYTTRKGLYPAEKFFTVERLPLRPGPLAAAPEARASGSASTVKLDLRLPGVRLAPWQELTAILTQRTSSGDFPLATMTPWGERLVLPIPLFSGGPHGIMLPRRARFEIRLKTGTASDSSSISIYTFDSDGSRLLVSGTVEHAAGVG